MKTQENEKGEVTISEAFSGFALHTDAGVFRICQRDGGFEIYNDDGVLIFSTAMPSKKQTPPDCQPQ